MSAPRYVRNRGIFYWSVRLSRPIQIRSVVVKVHRYLGLSLALFLIVIAATGSVITFYHELERTFNAHQRVVLPRQSGWTLHDLLVIRQKLEDQDPRSRVFSLQFPMRPDESVFSRVMGATDPATGQPYELNYTEVFANPYTGERLGERRFGEFSLKPENLISQIYFLHYALVFPELAGAFFVGILSFVWAFDCFFGFYLTLPQGRKVDKGTGKGKSFMARWKPAWQIKRGAAANRVIYDTHRASGLWLWPILLIFAVTGVTLNLPGYYAQFVSKFSGYTHFQENPAWPTLARPLDKPPVDWFKALALGQRYFAEQAKVEGFTVGKPAALEYRSDLGV
ncbi:MAG: PepSY-associated TM helix domain-containing protein, partial [Sphingobium sp.]